MKYMVLILILFVAACGPTANSTPKGWCSDIDKYNSVNINDTTTQVESKMLQTPTTTVSGTHTTQVYSQCDTFQFEFDNNLLTSKLIK